MKNKELRISIIIALFILGLGIPGCEVIHNDSQSAVYTQGNIVGADFSDGHSKEPYVEINGNMPVFSEDEIATESYEQYSELDDLGRCGAALACVGIDLMPVEERGNIGQIRPSGWHTVKYDEVDGKYLYNRCHLIGYQLSGENANEKNLITGTRYLNVTGMLPFEDMVADYVMETHNHVMYRVTPVFEEDNLLASGVQMEGYSVEDSGEGISFNVFVYNRQPGIVIDYETGESYLDESYSPEEPESGDGQPENREGDVTEAREAAVDFLDEEAIASGSVYHYVVNINTMRFHLPDCDSVNQVKEDNRKYYGGTREQLIETGYVPCGKCKP